VVTPIHAANNTLGGPAVFLGPYNWLNDLLHRGAFDLSKDELKQYSRKFFEITQDCDAHSDINDGECVQFRLDWKKQSRLYLGKCKETLLQLKFETSPCLHDEPVKAYDTTKGHKNTQGLTTKGKKYLGALLDRGMIIDTAHMSDASVDDTYQLIVDRLVRDHPACNGYSLLRPGHEDCDRFTAPAIISHAHFRGQARYGAEDFMPSEYDISNHHLAMLGRVGGVVGPFIAEDRIATPWDPALPKGQEPLTHDCAMSSKSFAYSFHFARQKTGGGVGMATDFTFIPATAPRFGKEACWAYHLARDPKKERKDYPDQYDLKAQQDGVLYDGYPPKKGVRVGNNVPLKAYELGQRVFDFNIDGLAHFGLVPDLLQDLKNLRMPNDDFEALFSSAEAYIQMWEKAQRAAHTP
jgi:microsomal dipeptidase-like Zn-dependent dipeptidase